MLINNKSMITITENNSTLKNKKGSYMGDSYSVSEVYQNFGWIKRKFLSNIYLCLFFVHSYLIHC